MRLIVFLFFVSLIHVSASVYSQKTKMNIKVENATLQEVFQVIQQQSDFDFFYKNEQIPSNARVSVQYENEAVEVILNKILSGTGLTYHVIDKDIVISTKEDASGNGNVQQQKAVVGKVTDASGGPLPGVSVVLKGTTNGTITDTEGSYSLSNVPGNATLQFSFVGMKSQEIAVAGKTSINVVLVEETVGIEEVVAIGYGTQKKINVIGSITTVSNEKLTAAPVGQISNAIAGIMPGAIVQQSSGEPGNNASKILIRGKATLGDDAQSAPLVVVDGIAGRDMNSIQSTDIESISVLKDASAAIYGARAANGVILITTKRGKEDAPPTLSYGFYKGVLTPSILPKMADAATYASMVRELQTYNNVAESNMMYSLADIEKYRSGKFPWTHPNTDWYDEVLNDYSSTSNQNLSISGGSNSVTYYGSVARQKDDGIYTNNINSYERFNLKASIDAKINKYLTLGIDMNAIRENSKFPTRGQGMIFQMTRRGKPTFPAFYPNGLPGPDIERGDQPVVISGGDPGSDNQNTYRLNSKVSATLKVPGVQGLTLSGYYAYDKYFKSRKLFERPFTLYSLDKTAYLNAGNTGVEDGSAFLKALYPSGQAPEPRLNEYYDDNYTTVFNLKVNYDKTFAGVHNVSAFVSMESSDTKNQGISAFRRYFISDQLPYLFAGGNTEMSNGASVYIDSRLNYFGRVQYNFKETYLVEFSLRRDGSLRFSKESGRWGTFPSVLAGWRISNENFWKNNIHFFDSFKLKASYGQMGNDNVSSFQYLTSYGFNTGMVLGSNVYATGLSQSGTPNPNITWEVANVYNGGFESSFLNQKMSLNTDFFYQRRSNILVTRNASVPKYTGIALPSENFGIVDSKGFEIVLEFNDRKGDFGYGISGNYSFARNKIINFDEAPKNVPWQTLTGHPQGVLTLYKSIGIFRDQAQIDATPHVAGARPGDIIIEDYDKNGKITTDDKIIFDKSADPESTFGLSFHFEYKNWSLRGLIQGAGATMRNIASDVMTGLVGNYYAYEAEDRWTVDNINATKPRAYEREEPYWRTSYATDYNYQLGGYVRMKNLSLNYSVPKHLLKAVLMKDANLYFSSTNPFLIYNQNKIMDPEQGNMNQYPIMKVYTLGLKVTF